MSQSFFKLDKAMTAMGVSYYYRARMQIKKESLPVIFKSDYPSYLFGDCVKKRFASGLVLSLRIIEKLGTEKPATADYLCFPQIISEI